MAKPKVGHMTTLDEVSLVFVGVCTVGIAYLVLVEPLREWLHHKKKRPKR